MTEWTDAKKFAQFRAEIHRKFEAENAAWRAQEEAEIAALKLEGPIPPELVVRDSFYWEIYSRTVFKARANSVRAILPIGFAHRPEMIEMFGETSVGWSSASLSATIMNGEPHVVIDVLLIDSWDDERHAEWLAKNAKHPPKLSCGCHCEGGCGDPYAACMWPCAEHVPF